MSGEPGTIRDNSADSIAPDANAGVRDMQKRFRSSANKWKEPFRQIRANRKYLRGLQNVSDERDDGIILTADNDWDDRPRPNAHQANVVLATLQTMLPMIYARNPEISVKAAKQVEPQTTDYSLASNFAETLELVLNRSFSDAGLKAIAKQMLRSIQTSRIAVVKLSYQHHRAEDPIIRDKIVDAQERLASVRARTQKIAEGVQGSSEHTYTPEELEFEEQQLQLEVNSLNEDIEVLVGEGLRLSYIRVDDFRLDPNIDDLVRYREARWMGHVDYQTPDEVRQEFGVTEEQLKDFTKYKRTVAGIPRRMGEEISSTPDGAAEILHGGELIAVNELWDKRTRSFYTWAEGGKDWLRPPETPKKLGERWYPFFVLGFNWLDGEEWPLSDVELLMELGKEYEETRVMQKRHRRLSAPHYIGDKSRIKRNDVETFRDAALGEIALINAAGSPVDQVFKAAEHPPMRPEVYDTLPIRHDIEWISGTTDAQKGSIITPKTATEAQIQAAGLGERVGEKRDTLEECLTEMSQFSAELVLLNMSKQKVYRIAGLNAVWPDVNKQQLYTMVEVEIRAGSLGKPDQQQEIENWSQILPLILQQIQFIMQLRTMGVPDNENPYVQVLLETLSRFDERIDLEKFLPGQPPQQPGMPGVGMGMGMGMGPPGMGGDPGMVGPQGAVPGEMMQQQQMQEQQMQDSAMQSEADRALAMQTAAMRGPPGNGQTM